MRILKVKIGDPAATELGWHFPEIRLKKLNLFVGESASGKSSFLNFLFTIAVKAVQDKGGVLGTTDIWYEEEGHQFRWTLTCAKSTTGGLEVRSERLSRYGDSGDETPLIVRDLRETVVKGKNVPRLSSESTALYVFREDEDIKPAHTAFTRMLRRDFAGAELVNAFQPEVIRKDLLDRLVSSRSLQQFFDLGSGNVGMRLFLLQKCFPAKFEAACSEMKKFFPSIEDIGFTDISELDQGIGLPGKAPILCIREKGNPTQIQGQQLSSGMKKTLLIITDVVTSPPGTLYLLDEYENSLGLNALNLLPSLLSEFGKDRQFLVSSHHPYMINAIPIESWIVFHRRGQHVSVKHGDELVESYGKSKQQAFIKLINDPFFSEGK
jgi:hypothetical protein